MLKVPTKKLQKPPELRCNGKIIFNIMCSMLVVMCNPLLILMGNNDYHKKQLNTLLLKLFDPK